MYTFKYDIWCNNIYSLILTLLLFNLCNRNWPSSTLLFFLLVYLFLNLRFLCSVSSNIAFLSLICCLLFPFMVSVYFFGNFKLFCDLIKWTYGWYVLLMSLVLWVVFQLYLWRSLHNLVKRGLHIMHWVNVTLKRDNKNRLHSLRW